MLFGIGKGDVLVGGDGNDKMGVVDGGTATMYGGGAKMALLASAIAMW